MAHRRLSRLFDDLEIETIFEAESEDLELLLRDAPGEICRASFDASGEAFSLFARSIPLRGAGHISARAHAPGATVEVFDSRDVGQLPADQTLVDLKLDCDAAVNPTRRRYKGPRLELIPRADTCASYRHLRSLPAATTRKDAVVELVRRARLPHHFDLSKGVPAVEIHTVSGRMRFNLNLDFEVGWRDAAPGLDFLLRELGDAVPLEFDLQVSAAFGLAMAEEFELTVGRGPSLTQNPGWVRACISRTHQRELTFGARFALAMTFNLGDPLEILLDQVLDRRGWRRVGAALATLDRMAPAFEAAAAGDWQTLEALAGVQTAAIVSDILEKTRALESDDAVSIVRRIVEVSVFYEELAPQVQGLWDVLLEGASLDRNGPVFEALELIAAIADDPDGDVLTAFLAAATGQANRAIEPTVFLLELLTGIDFETIVIGGSTVRDHLIRAAHHAATALAFLKRLNELPLEIIDGVQSALESTRIGAVIGRILEVESPGDLGRLAGTGAGAIVTRVVGVKLEHATAEDLARVRRWADALNRILGTRGIRRRLREGLAALNGELGFSLGLELDLATRRSRVLDLELDPAMPLASKVLSDLGKGNIRGVINRLSADPATGFLLHDCVFTSRRTRVAAVQTLLSLLGWKTDTTRRVVEDWTRVEHAPAIARRRARFAGGVVRRIVRPGNRCEGAAWLTHRVRGGGLDPSRPFDPGLDCELRLSLSIRRDEATLAGLRAVDDVLFDLGFLREPRRFQAETSPDSALSMALSLRLGSSAVEALLGDLEDRASWCVDARNALHRWFSDRSIDTGVPGRRDIRRGDACAELMRSSLYSRACSLSSLRFETEIANASVPLRVVDRNGELRLVHLRLVRQTGGAPTPHPAYAAPITAVQGLLKDARRRLLVLATTHDALRAAEEITTADLSKASSRFCRAMTAVDNGHWPNPNLPLWLVVSRLARTSPQSLADARGVATVRTRAAEATEWEFVERLQTINGIPRHRVGDPDGVFPIAGR